MNIKLDESYRITADGRQYILAKKVRDREEYVGFYSNLSSLLEDFISTRVRKKNLQSIKELLEAQKKLIVALNKAIHPLKIEVKE